MNSNKVSAVVLASSYLFSSGLLAQTIDIGVGISAGAGVAAPELAVAQAIEALCPQMSTMSTLTPDQQALLTTCTNILSTANTTERTESYNAISARLNGTLTVMISRSPSSNAVVAVSKHLNTLKNILGTTTGFQEDKRRFSTDLTELNKNISGGNAGSDNGKLSGFISTDFTAFEQDKTNTEASFDGDTYGITAGADYRIGDQLFIGSALSFQKSSANFINNGGDTAATSANLALFATYSLPKKYYVDATLYYGNGEFDLTRSINFIANGLNTNTTAQGTTDGTEYGMTMGGGIERSFSLIGQHIDVQAFSTLLIGRSELDEYTEKGAPGLNLTIDSQTITSATLTMGGILSKAFSQSWGVIQPQTSLAYIVELNDGGEDVSAQFSADPFATKFKYTTSDRDNSYFQLSAGASAILANGISGFVQYETLLGYDNFSLYVVSLGARVDF